MEILSYLCYLKKKRIIGKEEFGFVEYEIVHLLKNEEVIKYLSFIDHYAGIVLNDGQQKERPARTPFSHLLAYARQRGLLK